MTTSQHRPVSVTAKQVVTALAERHWKDVFIPECNTGSAYHGCRRIDAWAMPKSWSPWRTVAYEVKVSRGDWLKDNKWNEYKRYCHELWIACPWKLVLPEEVPAGIGLLWLNAGGKLVAKRKAVRHDPDPDALISLMSYALMSRARIVENMWGANGDTAATVDDWRAWADQRRESRYVGMRVRTAIRKQVRKRVGGIVEENAQLRTRNATLERIATTLADSGLDPNLPIRPQLDAARGRLPSSVVRELDVVARRLRAAVDEVLAHAGEEWRGT